MLGQCSARFSVDRTRLIVAGYSPELVEFYHTLPEARYSKQTKTWTCRPTPAAIWRLEKIGAKLPADLQAIAAKFDEAIKQSRLWLKADVLKQPEIHQLKSWRHQVQAYWFAREVKTALLAMAMGTGKSKVAVDLVVNWKCRLTLVLCPVSVRAVWRREFQMHAGNAIQVLVLEKGTSVKKVEQAESYLARLANLSNAQIAIVVNYETALTKAFSEWSLCRKWDCVILDESHRVKTYNSQISKYVAKLGKRAKYRLCLTGMPMGQSQMDLFGQFRFLDPGVYGTSYHWHRGRYAICGNPNIPQQITGFKNQEEFQERMALLTFRVGSDVLDLPDVQHETRKFPLNPRSLRAYRDMERELIAQIEEGTVRAANALVRLLRLQQITSGFLPVVDERGRPKTICIGREKRDVLMDILSDVHEPVVIFCRFVNDLTVVREVACELNRRYGELSGEQNDLTETGLMPPDIDILGAQIRSGGIGIDLTRARIAIYYSLGFSLTDYEQSAARVHRSGQDRPVIYYHLVAAETIDMMVYAALQHRKKVIDDVLSILKRR